MSDFKGGYCKIPRPHGVERWRLAFRSMPDFAVCDCQKRVVWLRKGQTVDELAATLIHEAVHLGTGIGEGLMPDNPVHDAIERVSAGAVAMMLKLGLLATEDD